MTYNFMSAPYSFLVSDLGKLNGYLSIYDGGVINPQTAMLLMTWNFSLYTIQSIWLILTNELTALKMNGIILKTK